MEEPRTRYHRAVVESLTSYDEAVTSPGVAHSVRKALDILQEAYPNAKGKTAIFLDTLPPNDKKEHGIFIQKYACEQHPSGLSLGQILELVSAATLDEKRESPIEERTHTLNEMLKYITNARCPWGKGDMLVTTLIGVVPEISIIADVKTVALSAAREYFEAAWKKLNSFALYKKILKRLDPEEEFTIEEKEKSALIAYLEKIFTDLKMDVSPSSSVGKEIANLLAVPSVIGVPDVGETKAVMALSTLSQQLDFNLIKNYSAECQVKMREAWNLAKNSQTLGEMKSHRIVELIDFVRLYNNVSNLVDNVTKSAFLQKEILAQPLKEIQLQLQNIIQDWAFKAQDVEKHDEKLKNLQDELTPLRKEVSKIQPDYLLVTEFFAMYKALKEENQDTELRKHYDDLQQSPASTRTITDEECLFIFSGLKKYVKGANDSEEERQALRDIFLYDFNRVLICGLTQPIPSWSKEFWGLLSESVTAIKKLKSHPADHKEENVKRSSYPDELVEELELLLKIKGDVENIEGILELYIPFNMQGLPLPLLARMIGSHEWERFSEDEQLRIFPHLEPNAQMTFFNLFSEEDKIDFIKKMISRLNTASDFNSFEKFLKYIHFSGAPAYMWDEVFRAIQRIPDLDLTDFHIGIPEEKRYDYAVSCLNRINKSGLKPFVSDLSETEKSNFFLHYEEDIVKGLKEYARLDFDNFQSDFSNILPLPRERNRERVLDRVIDAVSLDKLNLSNIFEFVAILHLHNLVLVTIQDIDKYVVLRENPRFSVPLKHTKKILKNTMKDWGFAQTEKLETIDTKRIWRELKNLQADIIEAQPHYHFVTEFFSDKSNVDLLKWKEIPQSVKTMTDAECRLAMPDLERCPEKPAPSIYLLNRVLFHALTNPLPRWSSDFTLMFEETVVCLIKMGYRLYQEFQFLLELKKGNTFFTDSFMPHFYFPCNLSGIEPTTISRILNNSQKIIEFIWPKLTENEKKSVSGHLSFKSITNILSQLSENKKMEDLLFGKLIERIKNEEDFFEFAWDIAIISEKFSLDFVARFWDDLWKVMRNLRNMPENGFYSFFSRFENGLTFAVESIIKIEKFGLRPILISISEQTENSFFDVHWDAITAALRKYIHSNPTEVFAQLKLISMERKIKFFNENQHEVLAAINESLHTLPAKEFLGELELLPIEIFRAFIKEGRCISEVSLVKYMYDADTDSDSVCFSRNLLKVLQSVKNIRPILDWLRDNHVISKIYQLTNFLTDLPREEHFSAVGYFTDLIKTSLDIKQIAAHIQDPHEREAFRKNMKKILFPPSVSPHFFKGYVHDRFKRSSDHAPEGPPKPA